MPLALGFLKAILHKSSVECGAEMNQCMSGIHSLALPLLKPQFIR